MSTETDKPTTPQIPLNGNAADVLIRTGQALAKFQTPPEPFAPFTLVPQGFEIQRLPLKEFVPLPDHIRQEVRLDDPESFIAYVKKFRTHTTTLFASAVKLADLGPECNGGANFSALLDYHEGGKEDGQKARRVAHIATYPVPLSLEFSTWLEISEKPQNQMDFVTFIERNGSEVISPSSADLVELALNFEAKIDAVFQSRIDRTAGGRSITFQENVEPGAAGKVGQMKVPESLALRMPIFEGGKAYDLTARLEYRVDRGRLTIAIVLQRPHVTFRTAIKELRQEISDALDSAEILTGTADLDKLRAEQDEE